MDSILVHNSKGKVDIPESKFDYFFGRVNSNSHNTARSLQNKQQLESIGIYDTPKGREIINNTINQSIINSSNIQRTFTKTVDGTTYNLETREMLIQGVGGIRKLEATFDINPDNTRKLTTIIIKGGIK